MATPVSATPQRDIPDELRAEVARLRLLHAMALELGGTLDFDELLPRVFDRVLQALGAEGGSLWIADGDVLRCRLAAGGAAKRLIGAEVPVGTGFIGDVAQRPRTTIVTRAIDDPRYEPSLEEAEELTSTVMATAMVTQGKTVGAIQVTNKVTGTGAFDASDRELLEGLAATAAVALRNAQLHTTERRARDLELLLEISREITSTLDLNRVLRSVVNLAARALSFDRGAVALVEQGRWTVRAMAGQETVNPKDPAVADLAVRAAWAAGHGQAFYLGDRGDPGSDAERQFVAIFGEDLERAGVGSGLYLPLRDDEGVLGLLLFEAERAEFAPESARELAMILANQTSVAVRNAQLYDRVPFVDAFGAIAGQKRAWLALPKQRRLAYVAIAVVVVALATLVRWPLRVSGADPVFHPLGRADVHTIVPGVVAQVLVDEGTAVPQGAPLVRLRDAELRAERAAAAADVEAAERAASLAASRGAAGDERLQRVRADALRGELALLDEQLAATVIRAPRAGIVLTPRPQERLGVYLDAGDRVLTIGRADTLELEFGVAQRDVSRVRPGDAVHLRVDALPQRTFVGRVTSVGVLPVADTGSTVRFPVRALVPNPDGLLRPGMAAHARVLTAPASLAGRLLRDPARAVRLLWWRFWS
jgi:GAF domain-containing protein/multidrug resistance efflux pump